MQLKFDKVTVVGPDYVGNCEDGDDAREGAKVLTQSFHAALRLPLRSLRLLPAPILIRSEPVTVVQILVHYQVAIVGIVACRRYDLIHFKLIYFEKVGEIVVEAS